MALGDGKGNSNNGGKKLFENQYYSRIGFKQYNENDTRNNDKRLGISYKSGMMILEISRAKEGGFEYESLISVYITATKAKIFGKEIDEFKKDIENGNINSDKGYGINTGMGETQTVTFLHKTDNEEYVLTISKVDSSGNITNTEDFVFNKDFHYGIEFNDYSKMDFNRHIFDDLEFEQLEEAIKSFATVSNGAIAYTVADLTRYDYRAILNKMNPIYDALGIDRGNNGNSRNSGGGFFNNGKNENRGTSNHKSYEDMEEDLPFEED